ncbi:MAG: dihydrofolate reductase [Sphaerochaetaceae bacterium]|nr:dihydrofolate reductase [Sphaerochaetaceae bacterium]
MNNKVLFLAEADASISKQLEDICDVTYMGWYLDASTILSEEDLIKALEGKDILVTSYDKVTRKVIENSPCLKLIVAGRANPVNVDVQAAKERNIPVAFVPGRNSDVTAEFAVSMILNLVRNVSAANRSILNRDSVTDDEEKPNIIKKDVTWGSVKHSHPYEDFKGPQIKGKTMGIIGYGSIGKRVGKIMHDGFGADLLIYDPYVSPIDVEGPGIKVVDLDTLLSKADFISCHTKITPATTGLFNYETFKKMKKTAYLINNSRGAIINEDDLLRALKEGLIAGAALDVFCYEPLWAGHPFLKDTPDNLLLTPHVSGSSYDAITNGTKMMVNEIKSFIKGAPLLNTAWH